MLKVGSCWYGDKSKDEHGNSVDFCIKYLGYSFKQAVEALQPYAGILVKDPYDEDFSQHDMKKEMFVLPKPVPENLHIAFEYLHNIRKLPLDFLQEFYLECPAPFYVDRNENIVFPSMAGDFAELRGTRGDFHGVVKNSAPDGYYATVSPKKSGMVLVCESAIDAISAYYLHGNATASMAGLKDKTFQRIAEEYTRVVISVDNDEAGDRFASKYYPRVLMFRAKPEYKDWNEQVLYEGKLF